MAGLRPGRVVTGRDGEPESAGATLVANEQFKLTATYLDGVAIATVAVGALAPVVALVSGSILSTPPAVIMALTAVCLVVSVVLHVVARRYLRGLRP